MVDPVEIDVLAESSRENVKELYLDKAVDAIFDVGDGGMPTLTLLLRRTRCVADLLLASIESATRPIRFVVGFLVVVHFVWLETWNRRSKLFAMIVQRNMRMHQRRTRDGPATLRVLLDDELARASAVRIVKVAVVAQRALKSRRTRRGLALSRARELKAVLLRRGMKVDEEFARSGESLSAVRKRESALRDRGEQTQRERLRDCKGSCDVPCQVVPSLSPPACSEGIARPKHLCSIGVLSPCLVQDSHST